MSKIVIIGCGASGMAAAVAAAQTDHEVVVLEHKDKPGKKILTTGNGRCNLTNLSFTKDCYRGEDVDFAMKVFSTFGPEDTLRFFKDMGLMTKARGTYLYPRSDQATSVLDAFLMEFYKRGIQLVTGFDVGRIKKGKKGFTIYEKNGQDPVRADKVILACGSKAASVTGSDGSGYELAKSFGHSLTPIVPALVQLKAEGKFFKKLSGIRTDATVTLYVDGKNMASDTGELQLTNYGISGIPVFQVSRYASYGLFSKKKVQAVLDFLPDMSEEEFEGYLISKKENWMRNSTEDFLCGVFNKKMIPVLLERAGIPSGKKLKGVEDAKLRDFAHTCKNFEVTITGTNDFEQAQICAGGVPTKEVNPETMESLFVPGLYLSGELLDVDGICGGYNLQWAWASGHLAGLSAAK